MTFSPIRFVDKDKDKALFFSTLRKRVDSYFKEKNISKHYNSTMVVKTIVMLSAYLVPFICILAFNPSFKIALILWAIMGFGLAGIGMSVMHDANHGAYATSHKINYWLGHTLNLLGGSVFNWKLQHNVMHHTYTNVHEYDDDIADKLILKFNPHSKVKWYHKLQFIYAFFFYGILTLYWALLKDFIQFHKYTKQGVNTSSKEENRIIWLKIFISKVVYWAAMFVLPVFVFHIPFMKILWGFLLMQFIAGSGTNCYFSISAYG